MPCASWISPCAKSPTTAFNVAHISERPVTLVSKNSSLCLCRSGRVHCRLERHTWARIGRLNCSPIPIFRRDRVCWGVAVAWEEARGLEVSGVGFVADAMAREESP